MTVLESTERTMQLRILVSAGDASKTWGLRCRVREALLAFVQNEYANCLPHLRGSFNNLSPRAEKIDRTSLNSLADHDSKYL